MEFIIVDTLTTYQHLLEAPDAETRETIFLKELVEPFQGLVRFFGGDALAVFASWGMSPAQFAAGNREQMQSLVAKLREADAQNRAIQALERGRTVFEQYIHPIPLAKVVFGLCPADMSSTPWNRGYTGFGGIPGWIMTVYGEATDYNLQRVEAATVHELHHTIMGAVAHDNNPNKTTDWNSAVMSMTVGEYMVNEGLAESFSAELYGEDRVGPWVSEFDDTQLTRAIPLFRDAVILTGFPNIQKYLYGCAEFGLPPTAGYALGYRIVQAYLKRSGKSVVEASLVPARQIIAESGFFSG